MKEGKGRETNTVSGKEGISDLKIIESRRKEKRGRNKNGNHEETAADR